MIMLLHGVWVMEIYMTLHVVLVVVIDRMCMITWCVICCAKCHFHPFLPASSITMPPSWKLLPSLKTPVNRTLRAYRLILPAFVGFPTSLHIVDQNRLIRNWKIDKPKSIYNACYTLHVSHFLVDIIQYTILHNTLHKISYSLQLYRYSNTVITM